jgi:predicted DNA-binding protein
MARPSRDMIRTNMYLPVKLKDAMKMLAKKQGRSYSDMVRQVMTEYVKTEITKLKNG